MKTTTVQPTHKDTAEFYRLALSAGVCGLPAVVRWADSIIGTESSPAYAFIELSLGGSQPISTIISLLLEVPGHTTPELSARMFLGYCFELARSGTRSATDVILQLYRISRLGSLPEHIADTLSWYEDELSLARDRVYGTLPEVAEHFPPSSATSSRTPTSSHPAPPNHALQRTEAGGRLFSVYHASSRQPLSLSLSPLGGTTRHP